MALKQVLFVEGLQVGLGLYEALYVLVGCVQHYGLESFQFRVQVFRCFRSVARGL